MTFDNLKKWCESKGLVHRLSRVRTEEVRCIHFFERENLPMVVYSEVSGNLQMYYVGYGHDQVEAPLKRIKTQNKLDTLYLKAQDFDFRTSRTKKVWDNELKRYGTKRDLNH